MRQQDMFKSANEPLEAWSRMWLGAFGSAQQSAEPAMKGVTSAQREMMELAARRTQAWFEWPKQIAECKGPQDLVAVSTAFWQSAAGDWNDTSRRIMSTIGVAVPAGATPRDHITFPEPGDQKGRSANDTSGRRAA